MLASKNNKNYQITTIIYALQAASLLIGVTAIIAIVMNYVKHADVRGTMYDSHFTWQMRTFWFGLFGWVVGFITHFILIGYVIWGITYLWLIYRVVKGWMYLYESRGMYDQFPPSGPTIINHEP